MIRVANIDRPRPPKTTTPMPLYSSDPAPGNITSGNNPNNDVSVDIKQGNALLAARKQDRMEQCDPAMVTTKTVTIPFDKLLSALA